MRVIAGKAKRLQLKAPVGMETRPTTDRIKETLFNMIQDELYDINFLDLFSGSGAIGIEALSRGARKAVFVEQDKKAVHVIKQNLLFTHLDQQAEVLNSTALFALQLLQGKEKFDIVFMDPPYAKGLEKEIIENPMFYEILKEHAWIIVEMDLKTSVEDFDLKNYKVVKEKIYKSNKHVFLKKI